MKYLRSLPLLLLLMIPDECYAIKPIDGDSLEINKARIRLHGIDAPEYYQTCKRYGRSYPCGKEALKKLKTLISEQTKCSVEGLDHYDRIIGQNIRKYRINARMSQKKIAGYLDITYQQVQKYETAKNRISARLLLELSTRLNVPIHEFFLGLNDVEDSNETKHHPSLSALLTQKDIVSLIIDYNNISNPNTQTEIRKLIASISNSK